MPQRVLPNFIIAGAPKAGTTWLYRQLHQNPAVLMSENKEPRYFAIEEGEELAFSGPGDDAWLSHFVTDATTYESLFESRRAEVAIGEASTDYLYRSSVSAHRMANELPDLRVIILLRQPAERAFSNWLHLVRDQHEPLTFSEALEAEAGRIEAGWAWWWHYVERGFYGRQLTPFFDAFPREKLLIVLHDELRAAPLRVLERVSRFLDIEVSVPSDFQKQRNNSRLARRGWQKKARSMADTNRALGRRVLPPGARRHARKLFDRVTLEKPRLSAAEARDLMAIYDRDLDRVESLTGLDLAHWR